MRNLAFGFAIPLLWLCACSNDEKYKSSSDAAEVEQAVGTEAESENKIGQLQKRIETLEAALEAQGLMIDELKGQQTTFETTIIGQSVDLSDLYTGLSALQVTETTQSADLDSVHSLLNGLNSEVVGLQLSVTAQTDQVAYLMANANTIPAEYLYDGNHIRRYRVLHHNGNLAIARLPNGFYYKFPIYGEANISTFPDSSNGIYFAGPDCSGAAYALPSGSMTANFIIHFTGTGYGLVATDLTTNYLGSPYQSKLLSLNNCVNQVSTISQYAYALAATVPASLYHFPTPITVGR